MLDTQQAAIVAYLTDGGVIHDRCLPDDVLERAEQAALDSGQPTGAGWRVFDEAIEDEGYQALSRYSIEEWESSQFEDLRYQGLGDFDEDDIDYSAETVEIDGETVDVSMYIAVTCDTCSERIS